MINDLKVSSAHAWKYVDDTTVAEIVPRVMPKETLNTLSTR